MRGLAICTKPPESLSSQHQGHIPREPARFPKAARCGRLYRCSGVEHRLQQTLFAVVDGNVKRVLARLFVMQEPVNQSASQKKYFNRQPLICWTPESRGPLTRP